jgi:hypothetical protein
MTNDRDELVSAYLDGEATPDEVALVESDPVLRAEADALRQLTDQLASELPAPPAALRHQHLDTALAAFDELAVAGADSSGPVIELEQRRAQASARSEARAHRAQLPSWLGAAAAVILVVGGIGVALRAVGGGQDDDAALVTAAGDDGDAGADEAAETEAEGLVAEAEASDEGFAEADEAAERAQLADDADTAAGAPAPEDEAVADEAAEGDGGLGAGGFFGDDERIDQARVELESWPGEDAMTELASTAERLEPNLASCGPVVVPEPRATLVGFVPVRVAGVNGEVLVYETEGGPIIITVATGSGAGGTQSTSSSDVPECVPLEDVVG